MVHGGELPWDANGIVGVVLWLFLVLVWLFGTDLIALPQHLKPRLALESRMLHKER